MLCEGRYETVAQFITVAIENQIQLEAAPLDQAALGSSRQESPSERPGAPVVGTADSLKVPVEEPMLVQSKEERSDEIVWGLYNRIFPVKITLRVLARLLVTKGGKSVELKLLREESALKARAIGKELVLADRTRGSGRGEKLATGLPFKRGDKSLDRFKNMFVGTISGPGKISGFPAALRFVLLQRVGERAEVSLTPAGFRFASLKNPILDGPIEGIEGTLSSAESDFYMTHIHRVLPREWELCHRIIESIVDGNGTPAMVDQVIKRTLPSLNSSMVAPTRAGIISRLDEIGLVQRRQNGLRVSYALTERGESFPKTAQEVTAGPPNP
jgi:DNA-binding HxlR family transcriptional regulator